MTTKDRWVAMLTFFVIAVVVFVFFWIRLQPIEVPQDDSVAIEPGSIDAPSVTFVNPARGAESPRVTLVEFGDFQCEACRSMQTAIDIALKTYPDDLRHVWKNLPNESAHPLATPAAIAAHCAGNQGKFWEYHDELFERQVFLSEGEFLAIAQDIELDVENWTACYERSEPLPIVKKDYQEGLGLGLIATPTIYIGDTSYVGALSTEDLIEAIQEELTSN